MCYFSNSAIIAILDNTAACEGQTVEPMALLASIKPV
jgi:hypothetical protein